MLKQLLRQGVLHRTKQVIFPENKQHVREFDILFLQLFAELHLKHDRYQNFQSSSLARKSFSQANCSQQFNLVPAIPNKDFSLNFKQRIFSLHRFHLGRDTKRLSPLDLNIIYFEFL